MSLEFIKGLLKDISPEFLAGLNLEGNILIDKSIKKRVKYYLRIVSCEGLHFLLLPVPHLYNEENDIEAGFAVDASPDNFDVYAYMYNYNTDDLLILSKLPHCVHRAFVFDAEDFSVLEVRDVSLSNRLSALLFINNYLSNLDADLNGTAADFFDDKLYQQLIVRLISVHDPNWCSDKLIDLRFEQLLANYNQLDESDPFYENNLLRANVHMINFLFGCEDNISNNGFLSRVSVAKLKPHVQKLYRVLFNEGEIEKARKLFKRVKVLPYGAIVQPSYKILLEVGKIGEVRKLYEWTKAEPDAELIKSSFKYLFERGWVSKARKLSSWSGIEPAFNELDIQSYYKILFEKCWVKSARKLYIWSGIEPSFNEFDVQFYYKILFDKGLTDAARKLFEWSGIKPREDLVQSCYKSLFEKRWIIRCRELSEWSGIRPNFSEHEIQSYYKRLFEESLIYSAKEMYEWLGIMPNKDIIQFYCKNLIEKGMLYEIRKLIELFRLEFNEDLDKI